MGAHGALDNRLKSWDNVDASKILIEATAPRFD